MCNPTAYMEANSTSLGHGAAAWHPPEVRSAAVYAGELHVARTAEGTAEQPRSAIRCSICSREGGVRKRKVHSDCVYAVQLAPPPGPGTFWTEGNQGFDTAPGEGFGPPGPRFPTTKIPDPVIGKY